MNPFEAMGVLNKLRSLTLFLVSFLYISAAYTTELDWQPTLTEYGHPDLQGYWNNSSQTPLQRPASLGDKRAYTEAEARELESDARNADLEKVATLDPGREAPQLGGRIQFQADENFANTRIKLARVNGEYRTSLVVEPADGRFPYVEGWQWKDIFGKWLSEGHGSLDGPEIRSQMERCLHVGTQMPPMFDWAYNANFQIVQTRDYVMLLSEMVHDARIIRLNSEHQPSLLRKWFGDSVGFWDGDTLVVHSRDFHPQQSNIFMRSSEQFEVTEWFTPVSSDEIFYRYRVVDPVLFTGPITVEMTLNRKPPDEVIYEFACHEGNYSLPGILAGARLEEIAASDTQ